MSTASTSPDLYAITRDAPEADRLVFQHNILLPCQGYYLHPDIVPLRAGARVADLATGSGIWITEFAERFPSTECHGFDISDIMYPANGTLPANVQLHLANVKQPFEERWLGAFDVVHIRYLLAAMSINDWSNVLRNVVTLLKPGGWLQWVENDTASAVRHMHRLPAPAGAVDKSSTSEPWRPRRMEDAGRIARKLMANPLAETMNYGYMNLDRLMNDPQVGGLSNVWCDSFVVDRYDDNGATRRNMAIMGIAGSRAFLKAAEARGEKVPNLDFEEWTKLAMEDIDEGAYWLTRVGVFVGQKPAELN